jgi:hypothetical protein
LGRTKSPAAPTKADQPINDDAVLMAMLQGLLAERLKLGLHRENTSTSSTGVTIDAQKLAWTDSPKFLPAIWNCP